MKLAKYEGKAAKEDVAKKVLAKKAVTKKNVAAAAKKPVTKTE